MTFHLPDNPKDARALLEARFGSPASDPMTPYQRTAAAIRLEQPDRVPFDFWAVPETIEKLKTYLAVDTDEQLLRLLGVDCRNVAPDYIGPPLEVRPDGSFFNVLGSHRRNVSNEFSTYEEYASFPLADCKTAEQVHRWEKWPHTEYFDWQGIPARIDALNADIPYYVRYEIGGIFETAWGLYGLDRFLTDLYDNPGVPCAILDGFTDLFIANFENLMQAAGGKIELVYTYDDVATQTGLLMSPKMWRKYLLPRHQRLNKIIKDHGVRIMYHSCGAIYPLIHELIDEMHIDILNPLQPRAKDMNMARIKSEFGSRIAFHGGVDLQETLPFGTTQDVVDEVRGLCRVLGKGGGYICTSAHFIQADVPVENILALYLAPRDAV
jgi:uroporphyrinogen decarboxylase